jgi:hypothetical protein
MCEHYSGQRILYEKRRYRTAFRSWLFVVTLTQALFVEATIGRGADNRLGSPTDLKNVIVQQREAIKSLKVSYTIVITHDPGVEAAGRLAGVMVHQDTVFAFSGIKRYCETKGRGFDTNRHPIVVERTAVYDGTDSRRRESKLLNIQKPKSAYTDLNSFTNALLWPITDAERQSCTTDPSQAHFLPYFLDDSTWTVEPDRQNMSGASCVVLTKKDGSRLLWVDPKRNWAVIRYEHASPSAGVKRWIYEYFDFEEMPRGYFLPRHLQVTHELLDFSSGKEIGNLIADLSVHELQINNVPDEQFVLEPVPGELVVNDTNRSMYRFNPTDDQTLDRSVQQSRSAIATGASYSRLARTMVIANVAMLTVFIIWRGAKWYRNRRRI